MRKSSTAHTQARSLQSRQSIIDSVVRLIAESGFSGATTSNIAANAGVSWGVLQYQFGSKEAIFAAVLESSTQNMLALLENVTPQGRDLRHCLTAAIETTWSCYSISTYRAAVEILMNYAHRSDEFQAIAQGTLRLLGNSVRGILQHADATIDARRARIATELMLATLRGFAISNAMRLRGRRSFRQEREALADALHAFLVGSTEVRGD